VSTSTGTGRKTVRFVEDDGTNTSVDVESLLARIEQRYNYADAKRRGKRHKQGRVAANWYCKALEDIAEDVMLIVEGQRGL
jgi:hypothetical protein